MPQTAHATRDVAHIDAFCTTGASPTRAFEDVIVELPPLVLEHGGAPVRCRLASRLAGPADAPVVAVLGGISAGRDVISDGGNGWWPDVVGAGRAVDTTRFRVLGIDWIAGRGCSSPASDLAQHAGGTPLLTPRDQARALEAALDILGIPRLHACIGASYGGMVALALGCGTRVDRLVVLGAAHEPHPMATALRALQREIVRLGITRGAAREALVLARGLAMTTYRSAREFAGRFASDAVLSDVAAPDFAVAGYLRDRGGRFADAFTPESFLCLSQSIDLHRVDPRDIAVPVTLVAFEPDAVTPLWQVRTLTVQLAGAWTLRVVRSIYGHDAFLKETAAIAPIVSAALCRAEVV